MVCISTIEAPAAARDCAPPTRSEWPVSADLDPGLGGASLDDGPNGHGAVAGRVACRPCRGAGTSARRRSRRPRATPGPVPPSALRWPLHRALALLVGLRATDRQGVRALALEIGGLEFAAASDTRSRPSDMTERSCWVGVAQRAARHLIQAGVVRCRAPGSHRSASGTSASGAFRGRRDLRPQNAIGAGAGLLPSTAAPTVLLSTYT